MKSRSLFTASLLGLFAMTSLAYAPPASAQFSPVMTKQEAEYAEANSQVYELAKSACYVSAQVKDSKAYLKETAKNQKLTFSQELLLNQLCRLWSDGYLQALKDELKRKNKQ